jgi:hypothetical protein
MKHTAVHAVTCFRRPRQMAPQGAAASSPPTEPEGDSHRLMIDAAVSERPSGFNGRFGQRPSLKLGDDHAASYRGPFRGRRTNSPPQFGHTAAIDSAHFAQNVHS